MRTLVESLKRLYQADSVTMQKLDSMLSGDKITQEEYNYITAQ